VPEAEVEEQPELPLLDKPRAAKIIYVESASDLRAQIRVLSQLEGPIAVDAERASGFKYSNRAYLLQLYRRGGPILLIDPIAVGEKDSSIFEALSELLNSAEWVLHAATQDIPCLQDLGLSPKRIFDTELGARIANLDRVGLGSACESLLGIRLAKEHSAVDWSTRPLREDWLNYAALDVDVLIDLRDAVEQTLIDQGKLEWATAEFERLKSFKVKAYNPDKWRGMSGLSSVKDAQVLAVAKALWEAREELAIKLDVSPGRLVPDASLVEASTAKHQNRAALAANRKFAGRASRTYIDTWWKAIERGQAARELPALRAPHDGIPNHRSWPQRFPEADARLKNVRAAVVSKADELSLPVENLISPDSIRQLCWQPIGYDEHNVRAQLLDIGARPWQIDQVAEVITEALSLPVIQTSAE